ncbi:class I SAM-dependent methyltransferase [Nanoarchaeota archaeon]
MGAIEHIKECRSCGCKTLIPIISLGEHHISNFIRFEEEQGIKVPLNLILCNECKLLQLEHNAPDELMWGDHYWYKSGINSMIMNDLKDIVKNIEEYLELKEKDIVVDIGCNDGTMFNYYSKKDVMLVGFEPSKNVAREAQSKAHKIINNFFNADAFRREFGNKKAKIITAISMFYDLEDPNKFLRDIVSCLSEEGIFVIQQNYVLSMLEQNALDNICHEHRAYYSLGSLEHLLSKYGLEVFDVAVNDINGGSIRTYIRIKHPLKMQSPEAKERLEHLRMKERLKRLDTAKPYLDFAFRIDETKRKLMDFLKQEKARDKIICISGASTRGNTTLQYFGIGPDLITAIADKNPDKWGKKTVGSLIPITSPDEVAKLNPDYLLVLIWYFFDEVKRNKEPGKKFILPLPEFKVIERGLSEFS